MCIPGQLIIKWKYQPFLFLVYSHVPFQKCLLLSLIGYIAMQHLLSFPPNSNILISLNLYGPRVNTNLPSDRTERSSRKPQVTFKPVGCLDIQRLHHLPACRRLRERKQIMLLVPRSLLDTKRTSHMLADLFVTSRVSRHCLVANIISNEQNFL